MIANHIGFVVDWTVPRDVRPMIAPRHSFPTRVGWKPIVIYDVARSPWPVRSTVPGPRRMVVERFEVG